MTGSLRIIKGPYGPGIVVAFDEQDMPGIPMNPDEARRLGCKLIGAAALWDQEQKPADMTAGAVDELLVEAQRNVGG